MEKLETLKLSKKEIDTSMGQEYIKKINESCEWPDIGQFVIEERPNEIMKMDSEEFKHHNLTNLLDSNILLDVGNNLATKIEENEKMFVQLEYLTRGTDARDIRDGHIKLMSQLSRCSSALWNVFQSRCFCLHFTETMLLYNLAAVISSVYSVREPENKIMNIAILVTNKKMIPLSKFFIQLCHDVGLLIPLVYANPNDTEQLTFDLWHEPSDNMGCTGVIAERSDIDSAIDVFINSSETAPWLLKQIYVQESVFEDFKDALAARSRESAGDLVVGNKTFLIECLGSGQAGIPTHAYRTTKELLSLIKTPYLSVWAAETALSHEIALRSPARTVWVNEYGTFHGPPLSALSVFNLSRNGHFLCSDKLKERQKTWAKLQSNERLEVIVAALNASKNKILNDLLPDFKQKWCSDDLLQVTDRTVCFGIQQPLGEVHIDDGCEPNDKQPVFRVLKVLLNGNAVTFCNSRFRTFAEEIAKMGVPIEEVESCIGFDAAMKLVPMVMQRLKVIRTNYGTIFAN